MKCLSKIVLGLALPLTGLFAAFPAVAATTTTTVPVTVTVIDSCTVSASPLTFGNYDSISGGTLDSVGTITPICTSGTVYAIALDPGLGNAATVAARKLTGPDGVSMDYGLYSDATRTTMWGDGTSGTCVNNGVGTGLAQSVMVYGRIPAAQSVMVGTYSDTITVTLTY